ncbi:hypothetical protein TYRP_014997 [Tyrophagus putrescentiae]|nr:hypothetical protein TYRP_014997 [Tyrophagus putrescentiae]
MNNESDLIANLHINPLGVILVGQFRFLNTLFGITIILVSFWITYLDYLFTYKMAYHDWNIILVMLVAVLAIAISNSFYLSERLLFKVQLALTADQLTVSTENRKGKQQQQWRYFCHRSSMLLAKLHLTVFYETICTKKKFRFTFGPHAKISYQSMFEFILFYSGFMLYVAKMFKNGRL